MAHSSRILLVEPNIVFLVASSDVSCLNVMLHNIFYISLYPVQNRHTH